MAIDYVKLAATAKRLVDANGREVVFRKIDSLPNNTSQPWKGPADASLGGTDETVKAVFVPPSSAKQLGFSVNDEALLKRVKQVLIVAPGIEVTEDLSLFDKVVDSGSEWAIITSEKLKPSTTTLIYFVGVGR